MWGPASSNNARSSNKRSEGRGSRSSRGAPAGVRSASIKNEARAKRRDPPFALVHNTGGPRPDMAHHLVLIDKSRPPKLTHTFSSSLPPPPHLPDRRQATPISRTPVRPDPALAQAAHIFAPAPWSLATKQSFQTDSQVCPHCPPGNTQHRTHLITSRLPSLYFLMNARNTPHNIITTQ